MGAKGGSMAELLMVMTLLIFFGISMYMLIFSGSAAMRRIETEKNEEIEVTNKMLTASRAE